jgi:hypothetical protein
VDLIEQKIFRRGRSHVVVIVDTILFPNIMEYNRFADGVLKMIQLSVEVIHAFSARVAGSKVNLMSARNKTIEEKGSRYRSMYGAQQSGTAQQLQVEDLAGLQS